MSNMNKNANNNLQNSGISSKITCSDSDLDRSELMKKIQALSFAKTETELYLDAHPMAENALSYYKDTVKKLTKACEEYEAKYGPLTAASVIGDRWSWIDGAWPWQYDAEESL